MRSILVLLLLSLGATGAYAAGVDNTVEGSGVSHLPFQDLRPLCPTGGETFQVRFQAYTGDLTAARVRVDDGTVAWIVASVVDARGPYDIWAAQVPATAATSLEYLLELTDGTDTDYYGPSGMSTVLPASGFEVDYSTLVHAPIGTTPATGGFVFKVWSPTRATAHVRGDFNGWGTGNPMSRVGEHFVAHVSNALDGHQYKFFFNNSVWNTDPRGRALLPGSNYNARVEDPFQYVWTSAAYETPDLGKMVIYQLHVGTFAGRNDPFGYAPHPSRYVDVTARVGHLAELGVNAVMLNPITEFPWDISAGYNPVTQWAPESKYGTADQLKAMVDAFHAQGIAVLLDIVWNHFSSTDNFLWNYDGTQIYFDDPAVDTPWGAQADFDEVNVRDYFVHSMHYWLEEYRLDGFRMDATDYMNQDPHGASGWALMQRLNDEMDNRWADRVAIAEQLPDDSWVTRPTYLGGAGFDSQYHDEFTDRLREEINATSPEMWKIRNIINGSGTYLEGRAATNYFELHDEVWPENGGQRMVKTIDPSFPHDNVFAQGRIKLAQGLTLLAPGVPAIHQGTEWLEDTGFEPEYEGRIDWSKKTTYAHIFDFFRDVIGLRTSHPALRADASWNVHHLNEGRDVVAFIRAGGDSTLVVAANFSASNHTAYRLGMPQAGVWREILNSQDEAYGGNGRTNPVLLQTEAVAFDGQAQSVTLDVASMGILVLRWEPGIVGVPDTPGETPLPPARLHLAPNPVRNRAAVDFRLDREGPVRLEVLDLRGRRVATVAEGSYPAGEHHATWNGRGDDGRRAPAGIYFLRLAASEGVSTRKFTILH